MFVSDLCEELITRSEESYLLGVCVCVCVYVCVSIVCDLGPLTIRGAQVRFGLLRHRKNAFWYGIIPYAIFWGSLVCIEARLWVGRSEFRIPTGTRDSYPKRPERLCGPPPPPQIKMASGFFLAGEAPRQEVNHSSPSVPMSKMSEVKPLLPLYDFMVWAGTVASLPVEVKHTFLSLNESGRCVNHV